ncbi:MAG: ThiF family adenylyltransferase [Chromatiales bacterium]|nr:ThiF family adenylyltransferase [Chromatiales bacterium]
MSAPWYDRWPEIWKREKDALATAGYEFEEDGDQRAKGRLVLHLVFPHEGQDYRIEAWYPPDFPFFPPEVFSRDLPNGRHIEDSSGLVCMLEKPLTHWHTSDTLAGYLAEQIPKLIVEHQHPDGYLPDETQEGFQVSGQMLYHPGSFVAVDQYSIDKSIRRGTITFTCQEKPMDMRVVRAAAMQILDEQANVIGTLDDSITTNPMLKGHTFHGRWVRLDTPPPNGDEKRVLTHVLTHYPDLLKPKYQGGPDIVGVLFPDEIEAGKTEEHWLFIVRQKDLRKGKKNRHREEIYYLARADRVDRKTWQARIPMLSPLANKKILLVGAGAIGSAIAYQLARAGIGRLHIVDGDHIQFANTVRWQYGFACTGHLKAFQLAQILKIEYPFLEVTGFAGFIGEAKRADSRGEAAVLDDALPEADLVIDATAEYCITHFLTEYARERNIPILGASSTYGARGGLIWRIVPGKTEGCWGCLERHTGALIPHPVEDKNPPHIQPLGCFHPAFPGTGMDLDQVSLNASRLAVSTLCRQHPEAYPDTSYDWMVINLWDDSGKITAPTISTGEIPRHPECPSHD